MEKVVINGEDFNRMITLLKSLINIKGTVDQTHYIHLYVENKQLVGYTCDRIGVARYEVPMVTNEAKDNFYVVIGIPKIKPGKNDNVTIIYNKKDEIVTVGFNNVEFKYSQLDKINNNWNLKEIFDKVSQHYKQIIKDDGNGKRVVNRVYVNAQRLCKILEAYKSIIDIKRICIEIEDEKHAIRVSSHNSEAFLLPMRASDI